MLSFKESVRLRQEAAKGKSLALREVLFSCIADYNKSVAGHRVSWLQKWKIWLKSLLTTSLLLGTVLIYPKFCDAMDHHEPAARQWIPYIPIKWGALIIGKLDPFAYHQFGDHLVTIFVHSRHGKSQMAPSGWSTTSCDALLSCGTCSKWSTMITNQNLQASGVGNPQELTFMC